MFTLSAFFRRSSPVFFPPVRSLSVDVLGTRWREVYDPANELPNPPIPNIPTTAEREGRPGILEFLVVGLVLGQEPKKYSTVGTAKSRGRSRDGARKARGTLHLERNVLRTVVQTADSCDTAASIKYYMACHHMHNLCNLRLITVDTIVYLDCLSCSFLVSYRKIVV